MQVRVSRVWAGSIGVVAVLAVAGCAGQDAGGRSSEDTSEDPVAGPAVAWTASDVEPVGQPVAVGDVAVVYESRDERLWLSAYDGGTGEQVWSTEATPSWTTPGVATEPQVVGPEDEPLVAMLARNDSAPLLADLALLDPATGDVVRTVPARHFRSVPGPCADDRQEVCVTAADEGTGASVPARLDAATGRLVAEKTPAGWSPRTIGPLGLVENGLRTGDRESLALVRDGAVAWELPLATAFGAGATTDNGWSFVHDPEHDVFVGTVGIPYRGSFTDRRTDLAGFRTVGIDGGTGDVLWTDDGTSTFCSPFAADERDPQVYVRCRHTGELHLQVTPAGGSDMSFDGLGTIVEGFDPRTGETAWSVDLGADDTLLAPDAASPMASSTAVALPTSDGTRVVDMASGEVRDAEEGEAFACTTTRKFTYEDAVSLDGVPVHEHTGGSISTLCDSSGDIVGGELTAELAAVDGAVVGDHTVVATDDGLVALRG